MSSTLFTFSQISNYSSTNFSYEPYDLQKYAQDPFQSTQITIQSIHDQKFKITKWLKQMSLADKIEAFTFTNKEFVTLIRSMFIRNEQKQFVYGISLNQSEQYELNCRLIQQKEKQYGMDFSRKQSTYQSISNQTIKFEDLMIISNAEQKLMENLRIMSKYIRYDSITFCESALLNVSDLLNTFEIIQDGVSQQLSFQQYRVIQKHISQKKENHLIFFDPNDQHYGCIMKSIYLWIVTAIKRNISLKYYRTIQNYLTDSCLKNINTKDTHNQLIESSYDFKALKLRFENYWKQHANFAAQLLKKVNKMNISQLVGDYRSILKVQSYSIPDIYCSSPAGQIYFQNAFSNVNPKNILEFLILDQIQQTYDSCNFKKYELLHLLEIEISKLQTQKTKKKKKGKKSDQNQEKDRMQRSISMKQEIKQIEQQDLMFEDQGECRTQNNDYIVDLEESEKSQSINFNQQQHVEEIVQKQQRQIFEKSDKKKKNKKKGVPIPQKNNKIKAAIISLQSQSTKSLHQDKSSKGSQTTNLTIGLEKNNKLELEKNKNFNQTKVEEKKFGLSQANSYSNAIKKIDEQVKNLSRPINPVSSNLNQTVLSIKKNCHFMQEPRYIVLKRIQTILFSNHLSYRLYGSSALQQQVLLPSSDLDISVDPTIVHYFYTQFCSYRDKILKGLDYLAEVLKNMQWTSQVAVRKNAAVPLLNFVAYPYQPFEKNLNDSMLNSSFTSPLLKKLQINVDITIDSFANMYQQVTPHKGYEATLFMRQWLNFYHHGELSYLVLLSKQLLFTNKLNKPYTGGMGAFTIFIIALAFLRSRSDLVCQQQQFFDIKRQNEKLFIKAQSPSKQINKQHIHIQIKRQKEQVLNKRKKVIEEKKIAKPLKINIGYCSPTNSQTDSPTNKNASINANSVSSICAKTILNKVQSSHTKKVKIIRNLDELFINFCAFVKGFDYSTYGIDIMKQTCASFKLKPLITFCHNTGINKPQQSSIPKKLVILSPINGQNLTQNCFQFDKIQKLFGKLSEVCMLQNGETRKKQLNSLFFGDYQLLLEQYEYQLMKCSKEINKNFKQHI